MSNVSLKDLDLSISASSIMDYRKPLIGFVKDAAIVGYLGNDDDVENPLESCDGMGQIYTCRKHGDTISQYKEALGFRPEDWNSSEASAAMDKHPAVFKKHWLVAATQSSEFEIWAMDTAGHRRNDDDKAYILYRAVKLLKEEGLEYSYGNQNIWSFSFTEDALCAAWDELREKGLVGDKHAVLLDVYSHGGERWSLAGHGMQCRFDTAGGAGVWVPDDEARKEIERRGKIYAYGYINDNSYTPASGKRRYWVEFDSGEKSPEFESWDYAFMFLKNNITNRQRRYISKANKRTGEYRAAVELASSALEEYNDWLAGDCYGYVVVTFNTNGDRDNPAAWEEETHESCWGFVGDDNAFAELTDAFNKVFESEIKKAKTIIAGGLLPVSGDVSQQPRV